MSKKNLPGILSPTDRREWKNLIKTRQDTMLTALESQIGINVDNIIAQLRSEAGVELTVAQLDQLVKNTDNQIKDELNKHLVQIRMQVEIKADELSDDFDQRERDMKQRHKNEWDELSKLRKEEEQKLKDVLKTAEEDIARNHLTELVQKKAEYVRSRNTVSELEMKITAQAQSQVNLMSRSRDRLINLITDAANRAVEKLMLATTADEAKELLETIPTVQEAIQSIQTADGLNNMFKRLAQPCLPPPPPASSQVTRSPLTSDLHVDADGTDSIEGEVIDVEIPTTADSLNFRRANGSPAFR